MNNFFFLKFFYCDVVDDESSLEIWDEYFEYDFFEIDIDYSEDLLDDDFW